MLSARGRFAVPEKILKRSSFKKRLLQCLSRNGADYRVAGG
jgi:hypothetical protein